MKEKSQKNKGENFAKSNKLNLFIESSAKTGFNSKKIFIKAAKMLYDEHLKYKYVEENDNHNSEGQPEQKKLEIMKQPSNKKNKGGCC